MPRPAVAPMRTIWRTASPHPKSALRSSSFSPRELALMPGEPLGEIRDRLGVDLRGVPLQQHLEIGRAFAPGLAALPAVALEIIRRGGKHIRHAADQIATAVAVIVYGIFQIGRRQELGLSDLARPGTVHVAWAHVAAVDNAQRGDEFAAKLVRPAAIVGQ